MAITQRDRDPDIIDDSDVIDELDDDLKIPNLLSLPNEVLVKIISFLPGIRDRVKLRCVSRKLRSISETPSLWREFVWFVNPRAEKCLHNVMKACGAHIKRLSFHSHYLIRPNVLPPNSSQKAIKLVKMSEMVKMLQYCNNVTHLNLPALDHWSSHSDAQLRECIQQMKYLEVLTVHCHAAGSFQPYLNLKTTLKELTIYTVIPCAVIQVKKDIQTFEDWKMNKFIPPNLNIIVLTKSVYSTLRKFQEYFITNWPVWNSQIPAGRVACFRLYINYKVPLDLFQNAPDFQLQYGEMATPPFVKGDNMGITEWFLLTDGNNGGKVIHKAVCFRDISSTMYDVIREYEDNQLLDNNLTELDLSYCNIDVKQILLACPQLQRLSLKNHTLRLDDLQMIATCCCNLQGLNLAQVPIPDVQFCVRVWEILSSMKLTHLSVDRLLCGSKLKIDEPLAKQLIALFKQCTKLQALELCGDLNYANLSAEISCGSYKLLSHFPSLEYCRLTKTQQSNCTLGIITTCEKLKYFYCSCSVQLSLSTAYYNNLQQLCISSRRTVLDDNFMDTVSAHGALIHAALFVRSMTSKGITTLIKNSPNLLTLVGLLIEKRYKDKYFESLSASLGKTFAHRSLFTLGFCLIQQVVISTDLNDWMQNTDLLSLWPSDFNYISQLISSLII